MNSVTTLIFIDTSSLLVSCWMGDDRKGEAITHNPRKEQVFWDHEVVTLAARGRLVLTARNYEELIKHSKSKVKAGLADRSKHVLAKLAPLIKAGTVEVFGDSNDPFADAVLLSVALKFRTQANLVFVTQDRALARDLLKVVGFESVRPRGGQTMEVGRVAGSGRVEAVSNRRRATGSPRAFSNSSTPALTTSSDKATEPPLKPWWERARRVDS